jgi:hypothetical protein
LEKRPLFAADAANKINDGKEIGNEKEW